MVLDHRTWRRGLLAANIALLFAAAVFCRAVALDHVPGLNGDEAWQGVQAQRWLRGESISWRTPTGNPVNLLFFLPLAALHTVLPPSITLLRLTSLGSGLAALALNYVLCRRVFGRQLAAISTAILAVLPATVAYSRFAWDTSQSVLVTLPVMYCALGAVRQPRQRRSWLLGAVAALCVAILVHPTNVFAGALLVAAGLWAWRAELVAFLRRLPRYVTVCGVGILLAVVIGLAIAGGSARLAGVARRAFSPVQWSTFLGYVVDLLSGTAIYRYIPGMQLDAWQAETLTYRLAAWTLMAAAAYGVWRTLTERRATTVRVLLAGLGLGSLGFFVVAGPQAIAPHFERYGMWLIGPTVLLLAMGLQWWMRRPEMSGRLRPAVAVLLAWGMLAGFGWYYLRPLRLGLGDSHVAFRTAKVEPKLAALRLMEAGATSRPTEIVARGWWAYWPLAYLAGDQPGVRIVPLDVPGEPTLATLNDTDVWQMEFVEPFSPSHSPFAPFAPFAPSHLRTSTGTVPFLPGRAFSQFPRGLAGKNWDRPHAHVILDAAGRPLLRIVPATTAKTGGVPCAD